MIKKLEIERFGPFNKLSINFTSGLNIIIGRNGQGKTQLLGALLFIYLGSKSVEKYIDTDNKTSKVKATFNTGITQHTITRELLKNNKYDFCIKIASSSDISSTIYRISDSLNEPPLIVDTWNFKRNNYHIENIREMLLKLKSDDSQFSELFKILNKTRELGNDKIYIPSGSVLYILGFLETIKKAIDNELKVLIIDGFGGMTTSLINKELLELINVLSEKIQFVITINQYEFEKNNIDGNIINLNSYERTSGHSPLTFKSSLIPFDPQKMKSRKDTKKHDKIIHYIENKKLTLEENVLLETKVIDEHDPLKSILSHVNEYVVSYLNQKSSKTLKILWGIDRSKNVRGINIGIELKDVLTQGMVEKISLIKPQISHNNYSISLHSVFNSELKEISERYIVEVVVRPSMTNEVYKIMYSEKIYILKGDLVGFSKIMEDKELSIDFQKKFEFAVHQNALSAFYYNISDGDTITIADHGLKKLVKIAKRIIEDTNELPTNPQIRMAIDYGEVTYEQESGVVTKLVTGHPLKNSARLEPYVIPNEIWCTDNCFVDSNEVDKYKIKTLTNDKLNIKKQGSSEDDIHMKIYRV